MQQLSSQISRENLKNYKLNNYNLELLNKTIIDNRTNVEIVDVTPIGKLLYKMINCDENDII